MQPWPKHVLKHSRDVENSMHGSSLQNRRDSSRFADVHACHSRRRPRLAVSRGSRPCVILVVSPELELEPVPSCGDRNSGLLRWKTCCARIGLCLSAGPDRPVPSQPCTESSTSRQPCYHKPRRCARGLVFVVPACAGWHRRTQSRSAVGMRRCTRALRRHCRGRAGCERPGLL